MPGDEEIYEEQKEGSQVIESSGKTMEFSKQTEESVVANKHKKDYEETSLEQNLDSSFRTSGDH